MSYETERDKIRNTELLNNKNLSLIQSKTNTNNVISKDDNLSKTLRVIDDTGFVEATAVDMDVPTLTPGQLVPLGYRFDYTKSFPINSQFIPFVEWEREFKDIQNKELRAFSEDDSDGWDLDYYQITGPDGIVWNGTIPISLRYTSVESSRIESSAVVSDTKIPCFIMDAYYTSSGTQYRVVGNLVKVVSKTLTTPSEYHSEIQTVYSIHATNVQFDPPVSADYAMKCHVAVEGNDGDNDTFVLDGRALSINAGVFSVKGTKTSSVLTGVEIPFIECPTLYTYPTSYPIAPPNAFDENDNPVISYITNAYGTTYTYGPISYLKPTRLDTVTKQSEETLTINDIGYFQVYGQTYRLVNGEWEIYGGISLSSILADSITSYTTSPNGYFVFLNNDLEEFFYITYYNNNLLDIRPSGYTLSQFLDLGYTLEKNGDGYPLKRSETIGSLYPSKKFSVPPGTESNSDPFWIRLTPSTARQESWNVSFSFSCLQMLPADTQHSNVYRTIIGGTYGTKDMLSYTASQSDPIYARVRGICKNMAYYKKTSQFDTKIS